MQLNPDQTVCGNSLSFCSNLEQKIGLQPRPVTSGGVDGSLIGLVELHVAWLNERQLAVAPVAELNQSLVATGFAYDQRDNVGFPIDALRAVLGHAKDVRRVGVAALDCAMVAAGWLSVYWQTGLKPWDVAAGMVLVSEAGGRVTDFSGDAYRLGDSEFLASNGHVHDQMANILVDVRDRAVS